MVDPSDLAGLRPPRVRTRAALLLLDLQNDFVRPWGRLPVPNVAGFLDALAALAARFRRHGDVVWVRSRFEARRPLADADHGAELVVLAGEDDRRDDAERVDDEAFLSTDRPCCLPDTPGAQVPAAVLAAVDAERDLVAVKTHYSALQSPGLVRSLRTRLVTDLYLAGALSNVSVYATALDAVRHGFAVTVLEDCLGFRSFARHAEAMRRMADVLGVNGTTVPELLDEADGDDEVPRGAATTAAGPEGGRGGLGGQGSPSPVTDTDKDQDEAGRHDSDHPPPIEIEVDSGDPPPDMPDFAYRRAGRNGPREARHRSSPSASSAPSRKQQPRVQRAKPADPGPSPPASAPPRQDPTGGDPPSASASASPPRGSSAPTEPKQQQHEEQPPPPPQHQEQRQRQRQQQQQQQQPGGRRKEPAALGPGDRIGEGDSRIVYDLDLPPDAFARIRAEVGWQRMYHLSGQVPRLVAVQGQVRPDGAVPIYRHPADESPPLRPWTPTVDRVRAVVERLLGQPVNHALIQLYRDGQDRISEHADKTLDIVRGSCIGNVSLGAQRTMILRTKASASSGDTGETRRTQRVPLPHRSLFVLGERTNRRWLHGIRPDRRPDSAKSAEERACGGERISLTFRHIGTFVHPAEGVIWGQGAVSKTREHAGRIVHGDPAETERLIRAFGRENHDPDFDWDAVYGGGFDVVNFVITRSAARLVPSGDPVADLRVRLCLTESGLRYEPADAAPASGEGAADRLRGPVYVDPEDGAATVAGDVEILSHVAQRPADPARPGVDPLRGGARLPQIQALLASWRQYRADGRTADIDGLLAPWDEALRGKHYLDGPVFGIDDCALWPLLREVVRETGPFSQTRFPALQTYYQRVEKRACVRAVLDEMRRQVSPGEGEGDGPKS